MEIPVFDKTNNIYSLWLARGFMAEEYTLLLESDLIFEDSVLQAAVNSEYKDCALVSKYEMWMNGTMERIDDDYNILNEVSIFLESGLYIPLKAINNRISSVSSSTAPDTASTITRPQTQKLNLMPSNISTSPPNFPPEKKLTDTTIIF